MIYYLLRICIRGCLAQPGEHHPYKVGVVGSSPSASTITIRLAITWRGSEEAKRG